MQRLRISRLVARAGLLTCLAGVVARPAFAQFTVVGAGVWSGTIECYVSVYGAGYTSSQRHVWSLTEAEPTMADSNTGMLTYRHLARWSVTGEGTLQRSSGAPLRWVINVPGVGAPVSIANRNLDVVIASAHTALTAPNALVARPQTAPGQPASGEVIYASIGEWPFPGIQQTIPYYAADTPTVIRGSSSSFPSLRLDRLQPEGTQGTANCTWNLVNRRTLPPPPPLSGGNVPGQGAVPPPPPPNTTPSGGNTGVSGRIGGAGAVPPSSTTTNPPPSATTNPPPLNNGPLPPPPASANGNWVGTIRCELQATAPGYAHQETQTWTLTGGAPTTQGAFQVFPATWAVTGQGTHDRTRQNSRRIAQWTEAIPGGSMSAPVAFSVAVATGQLNAQLWHSQITAPNAYTGTDQYINDGVPQAAGRLTGPVSEWQFPKIVGEARATRLSGSIRNDVRAQIGPLQPMDAQATVACAWELGR